MKEEKKPFRVIVAGGRNLPMSGPARDELIVAVCKLLKELGATRVVSGYQRGGDAIGIMAAQRLRLPIDQYPPDWKTHGKAAGPIRNATMAANAEALIVMRGGSGTFNMIQAAQRRNLRIEAVI